MTNQQNTETEPASQIKSDRNWNHRDIFFIVAPLLCIVLFPLGGLFYLCGRFSPFLFIFCIIALLSWFIFAFILYCFVHGAMALIACWGKLEKRRNIVLAQTVIPFIFIILFIAPFFIPVDSDLRWIPKKFLVYGLRDQVRSQTDIREIRDWLKTLSREDYMKEGRIDIYDNLPEPIKQLKPLTTRIRTDENGNPKIRLFWGSGIVGDWGIEIGLEDMEIPPSDLRRYGEYRLPVESGVYVWYEVR